ncbi:MAG: T9SS type A sorting domain-containing protein [Flavobacteriales bacterium]|nr:T9SS type A sorting domain-containing protein [Flavobacteriales bacterium]
MKNRLLLILALISASLITQAQNFRYVKDMFADGDIIVESDLVYGTNIDFLTSKLTNPTNIGRDITEIKTAMATSQPIPAKFYNPSDASTDLKVTDIKYDIYYPDPAKDGETSRPVVVYLHTGNFLPPCINGSPLGLKTDEIGKAFCMAMARKGYVAVSADYRLGWNPISDLEPVRKGTLLNAVYRAYQDAQMCIRVLKKEAAGDNKYGIDPDKVILVGEGTGAYVAATVNTLDKHSEITYPRFLNPIDQKPYVDTLNVGNLQGFGGTLNLYAPNGFDADISACITLGGALPDSGWLEAGDAPMMAFQCVRDPFAPFHTGIVIVPTTGESVVEVHGSNVFIKKANELGLNDALMSSSIDDDVSRAARSRYGKTYDYIYPAPRNKITVTPNNENQFPVVLPLGASIFQNTAQPWQFWDTASPLSKCIVAAPNITSDQASRQSNPNASPENGALWVDTITSYICPRLANLYGFVGQRELNLDQMAIIYPNPARNILTVEMPEQHIQHVRISDLNGRVVYDEKVNDLQRKDLNISSLNNGLYLLEIHTPSGSLVRKISVE